MAPFKLLWDLSFCTIYIIRSFSHYRIKTPILMTIFYDKHLHTYCSVKSHTLMSDLAFQPELCHFICFPFLIFSIFCKYSFL